MAGLDGPEVRAAVLAVGSELLTLGRTDTNSPHIAATLQTHGLRVEWTSVVGDDLRALTDAIGHALSRVDLVVCTGGLGPTDDDRTRTAVASVLSLPLHEDETVLDGIRQRFGRRGMTMPEINRRQAMVPEGAILVPNVNGTAPGLWIPAGGKAVLLLPGPPREMRPMLDAAIAAHIVPRWGASLTQQRSIVVAGRSESWVDERAAPLYGPWRDERPPVETTILASVGIVELHLSTTGLDAADGARRLDEKVGALAAVLGADVVSVDGASLEAAVGRLLQARQWRIALAESCTGGLATSRLTDVPGASAYVERAVVAYSNDAKTACLGVPPELLAAHGAVSEPVAVAMAEGARRGAGVDVAAAVTGIAGPGGATPEKPVGLVCFAVAGPGGTVTRTSRFTGDRAIIKALAATTVLDMVRRYAAQGGTP
ncbi:MAG: CinA family nicotinamide mononucleotide deamidase-related protein [Vicinamibacterales bacterium]